jgi:hypothetical protein
MKYFFETLRIQRWDDHRYYHHSRINQALHLVSALSFLLSYWLLVSGEPAAAALLAWLVAMTSRQAGHFFFEPRSYDYINQATHAHKEDIKVGYNLRRKVVLMSIWALTPLALLADPTLRGLLPSAVDTASFMHNMGLVWLALGMTGLLVRVVHLFFLQDLTTGLAWATKILTDPFHDVKLYWRAPLHLLRGELIDPDHARHGS